MAQTEETPVEKTVASEETPENFTSKSLAFLKELVVLIVTAFILALIFKTFVFQPFKVEMSSMVSTVMPDDRVLVNKFIYRFRVPQRGDVITLYSPEKVFTTEGGFSLINLFQSPKRILIKRVIANAGETIEIKSGQVYINNKSIGKEKYVKFKDFSTFGPFKVPKGYVFVMGDNRPNSKDSRSFGPIQKSDILGKAFLVYWPISAMKGL